jgi:PST family polysaccharide transporter
MTQTGEPTPASRTATDAAAVAASTSADERARLGRSLTQGVAWMGGAKWMSQLFTWVSTIVVARLLTPEDYGLVGYATLFLGIVTLFSEFGIGTTVVTLRQLSDEQLAEVNTLALLFGVGGFAVSALAAPLLATYFDAPNLTLVVIAMAANFVISALGVVPRAVLQRDLRYRELAINDGLQALLLAAGSVAFAVLGFRYWTLVLAAVLGTTFAALAARRLVPARFRWPRWAELAPAVRFSRQTIVGRLAWYVYSNADFLVAGKLFGKEALGAYRFAWELANSPGEKVTSLVGGVTPGVLSAAQHDPAALRSIAVRVTEALALVTLPACVGLSLVANNLVPLVLGEQWLMMVAPLQVLALAAALRSVTPILPQILVVVGRNRDMMRVNVLGAVVMPIAFVVGSRWGISGVALAWIAAYPIAVAMPMAWMALRSIGLGPLAYLRAFVPSVTGVTLMAAALLALRQLQPAGFGRLPALVLDIGVGGLAYVGSLLLFHRAHVMSLVQRVRSGLRR